MFFVMFLQLYSCCHNLWKCLISGGDGEGPWFLPDILVNVRRPGDDPTPGVIREMLPVSILLFFSLHIISYSFSNFVIS